MLRGGEMNLQESFQERYSWPEPFLPGPQSTIALHVQEKVWTLSACIGRTENSSPILSCRHNPFQSLPLYKCPSKAAAASTTHCKQHQWGSMLLQSDSFPEERRRYPLTPVCPLFQQLNLGYKHRESGLPIIATAELAVMTITADHYESISGDKAVTSSFKSLQL